MPALWVLLILSLFGLAQAKSAPGILGRSLGRDLKLVHVVFRHGARTPADTYPNDIYINETLEPYGWGQLMNNGKAEMYELGEFLRERYKGFLSKNLKLSEVHAQSTDVSRTKMSIQLVLASLFAPINTDLEWNKNLNWQPVPYSYEKLSEDSLLLVRKKCPRYSEELERVLNEDVKAEISSTLLEELSNITGLIITTPDDVQSLYSTLKAEKEYGLELPKWTENYFPDKLQKLTDKSYIYNAYNSELKRLKGGVFVKKAINDWKKKKDDALDTKIFIYCGHDSSVTNVLSAFNVWTEQFPDYGYTAILEFSKHKINGTYGVEIFLRKGSRKLERLMIPKCDEFCELSQLESILAENIPGDWQSECKAKTESYTPPPPVGP